MTSGTISIIRSTVVEAGGCDIKKLDACAFYDKKSDRDDIDAGAAAAAERIVLIFP